MFRALSFIWSLFLFAPLAYAQQNSATAAIDATSTVDKILNNLAAVAMIGGGVLLVLVTIKLIWWLRFVLAAASVLNFTRRKD